MPKAPHLQSAPQAHGELRVLPQNADAGTEQPNGADAPGAVPPGQDGLIQPDIPPVLRLGDTNS